MAIRLISTSLYRGESLRDSGGLRPTGLPVLARFDFENEMYTVGGLSRAFSDILTQSMGAEAFVYNPTKDAVEALANNAPALWTPSGKPRKALTFGQGFTATMGQHLPTPDVAASYTFNTANGSSATNTFVVQGRSGQIVIACPALGFSHTVKAGEVFTFTSPSYPGGVTSTTWTVTPTAGITNWFACRTNYIIGVNRGTETYTRRAYAFTPLVRNTMNSKNFTLVFSKILDVPTHTNRPFMELLGVKDGFAMGLNSELTRIVTVNDVTTGPIQTNNLLNKYSDETWAFSFDFAAAELRVALNGIRFTTSGLASGAAFSASAFTLGALTKIANNNQAGAGGLRQMAILNGAMNWDDLREVSRSFL